MTFDAKRDIENSHIILQADKWPNFHDAEIESLTIWRGDIQPDKNIWIGPVLTVSFILCALEKPFRAILRFHDCEDIELTQFDNQNALYDLSFKHQSRGVTLQGEPLTPYILVRFEHAFGQALTFKCFKVEVLEQQALEDQPDVS